MGTRVKRRTRTLEQRLCAVSLTAAVLTATWAGVARAEGGELALHVGVGNESALLHHPDATYTSGGTWAYVPRFGFSASYGVTNWLGLGAGATVSLPSNVLAQGVVIQGLPAGTLDARYFALMVPGSLILHLTRGTDWSAELVASGGPAFSQWRANDLRSAAGVRLPLEPTESWYVEWFGRVAVLAEWRPSDWGAVSGGPYMGASSAGDVYAGVVLEAAFIVGAGPQLN